VKQLAILICTHNRSGLLARTLESLTGLEPGTRTRPEVIVVANACSDDTLGVVEGFVERVPMPLRSVEEPRPGLSVARNRGLAETTADYIAFLDDDVQVDPRWLRGLEAALVGDRGRAPFDLVGGRVDLWWEEVDRPDWLPTGAESLLSANDRGPEPIRLNSPTGVVGANFAFGRGVYEAIGGFREDLGRAGASGLLGGEESDWVSRALAAGFVVGYEPRMVLRHWVPRSRVTPAYLTGVAAGNERGRVRMKPPLTARAWARVCVGHLWMWLGHGVLSGACVAAGRRRGAMRSRILSRQGLAGLLALKDRLATRG